MKITSTNTQTNKPIVSFKSSERTTYRTKGLGEYTKPYYSIYKDNIEQQ